MANSKIYLGNTNIGSLFKGASDISIYLGENKVYPLETQLKFQATYSGGETYDLACDGNTTLTSGNTKPSGYEYSAMTEAVIGDCVTEIGFRAFSGCTNLSSVTIPDSVTSIGGSAFHDCRALTSVYVPDSVISIDDMSFRNCTNLTTVHLPSGLTIISNSLFLTCTNLTSIDIPSGVTSIGDGAIRFCQSLTSIDIPSGVTSIGRGAFYSCSGLTSVTVNAITPPTLGSEAFNGSTCPIYVPAESVEAYKTASGWSTYASRIQAIP